MIPLYCDEAMTLLINWNFYTKNIFNKKLYVEKKGDFGNGINGVVGTLSQCFLFQTNAGFSDSQLQICKILC